MHTSLPFQRALAVHLILAAALTACGGGNSSSTPSGDTSVNAAPETAAIQDTAVVAGGQDAGTAQTAELATTIATGNPTPDPVVTEALASSADTAGTAVDGIATKLSVSSTVSGPKVHVDSTSGNDANPGTADLPWRTLARAQRAGLPPGGAVLLKCGSIWRESVTVSYGMFPTGGGVVGNYGSCTSSNRPVISGANSLSSLAWSAATRYSGKPVYVAAVSQPVTQLYWNGSPLVSARMPDYKGTGAEFSLIKSANSYNTFIISDADRAAIGGADLVGATVTVRTDPWKLETSTVKGYDAATGTVTLTTNFTSLLKANQGYYISGKAFMLNSPGEWYYDAGARLLYVWTLNWANPASGTLETVTRDVGMTVQYIPNTRVENIVFDRHTSTSLQGRSAPGTVASGVFSKYAGVTGISLTSDDSRVEQSTVLSAASNGIVVDGARGVVKGNTVVNTGVGASALRPGAAISVVAAAGSVLNNTVVNSGYVGITMGRSAGLVVSGNDVSRACSRMTDCGAIYSWGAPSGTTRVSIKGNSIHDLTPNTEGAVGGAPSLVAAIYLDERSAYHDVTGNLITNIGVTSDLSQPTGTGAGVNLHNSSFNTIRSNKIWRVSAASIRVHSSSDGSGVDRVRGNVVAANSLFGMTYYAVSSSGAPAPVTRMVYSEQWVHYNDANQMFSGADVNVSTNNITGTLGANSVKWALSSPATQRTLSASEWTAFSTGDQVSLPFSSRLLLANFSTGNLVQNAVFAAPSTPWTLNKASTSIGAAVSFGACGDSCANFTPGSVQDSLASNTFQMSGAAGDNLYMFRMRAIALAPSVSVGVRLHRMYGDWGAVGYEVPSMPLPTGQETRVETLFASSANADDKIRLDFLGVASQSYQLREVGLYKVSSYELYNPWKESVQLSNPSTVWKNFSCADAKLRTCTTTDLSGNPVVWPVAVAPGSALVAVAADSKWRY